MNVWYRTRLRAALFIVAFCSSLMLPGLAFSFNKVCNFTKHHIAIVWTGLQCKGHFMGLNDVCAHFVGVGYGQCRTDKDCLNGHPEVFLIGLQHGDGWLIPGATAGGSCWHDAIDNTDYHIAQIGFDKTKELAIENTEYPYNLNCKMVAVTG